ncbi:ribokinase [Kaistia dalseonensis]|uniref:Ribokinase n=1 Tax=Kaistia dalseonensis TaxID=410840 RepID=A0ABU0H306_9HYPH|nr:ribokinase [Kaistia dalseonensis]MCX5494088.1 ribokinase [Kaistia dalseonensis]MDQ0436667.1 ribokinase [Kaistia dalseonensis]
MRFWVLGNAGVDETMAAAQWPQPGHTIIVGAPERDIGGKGANQALVLRRAGCAVHLVAPIGADAEGAWISQELKGEGLEPTDFIVLPRATDRSLIFVAPDGENAIASVVGCAASIQPADVDALLCRIERGDALLMQGNLRHDTTEAALALAKARGVRTVFNPSPVDIAFRTFWPLVDILVLNREEAGLFVPDAEPEAALRQLRRDGVGIIVLTLGREGAIALDREGRLHRASAEPVIAVDTTGAGDSFTGAFIAAFLGAQRDLGTSLRAATKAASITVTRRGTRSAFPTESELDDILGASARIVAAD